MKSMIAMLFALATSGAFAIDGNLFSGSVNATAAGGSLAGSTSTSQSALFGVNSTSGQALTGQASQAGGSVNPDGVTVGQVSEAFGGSQTSSGSLGFATGGSTATGGSGGFGAATGGFQTIGFSLNP
jgi:hypothetical protein